MCIAVYCVKTGGGTTADDLRGVCTNSRKRWHFAFADGATLCAPAVGRTVDFHSVFSKSLAARPVVGCL